MGHFRVSRNVIQPLAASFEASEYYKYYSGQNGKISFQDYFRIFLWYIGHQPASFRDVADWFDISKSSLDSIIVLITYFLSNMYNNIIKSPNNEEKIESERHFRQKRFLNVVGAINGCHIKIDKPSADPESFIKRKGYYCIQVSTIISTLFEFICISFCNSVAGCL